MSIKILVLGCGSIGKRHIRNLIAMKVGKIIVFDPDDKKRAAINDDFSVESYKDLDKALFGNKFDVAFICSPPNYHVSQALRLLEEGIHCFIEKPLSHDLNDIDKLIEQAEKNKKIVLVGYSIRFSSAIRKVKEVIDSGAIGRILSIKASVGYYLPFWRPAEDYKAGYGARKELGGGVVLDASHEIDYVRYLAGEVSEVFAVCKKISDLNIDTEDFAEITMLHKSGIYSQIHLDYLQSNYRRSCEIIGSEGMLLWDINERTLKKYNLSDKEYHVYYEGLNANVNEMYIEEVNHFFRCTLGLDKPLIDIAEGKRILEIVMNIKKSSKEKRMLSI